jgi:hypothetical protein
MKKRDCLVMPKDVNQVGGRESDVCDSDESDAYIKSKDARFVSLHETL